MPRLLITLGEGLAFESLVHAWVFLNLIFQTPLNFISGFLRHNEKSFGGLKIMFFILKSHVAKIRPKKIADLKVHLYWSPEPSAGCDGLSRCLGNSVMPLW